MSAVDARATPCLAQLARDLLVVAPVLITARALVAIAWIFSGALGDRLYGGGAPRVHGEGLLAWDGTWYDAIATVGYAGLPEESLRFFPLYPLLARMLMAPADLVISDDVTAAVGLVLVANVCAVAVAVMTLRLARAEGVGEAVAVRAAALVSLFPAGFVLVWGYSEALFLVGALAVFTGARSQRWALAAMGGLIAGGTRPLGVLLMAPLLVEIWMHWRSDRGSRAAMVAALLAPLASTCAYLAWVDRRFGDGLAPFTVQGDFRGEAVNPFERILRGFGDLVGPERLGDGLHVPFAVLFVVLAVWTFRVWPRSYGVFAVVVLMVALAADNLNSLQRYALNAFPLAMTLAVLANTQRRERLALAVCGCGLFALCSLAWLGVYVP